MEKYEILNSLKESQKTKAQIIRNLKDKRKGSENGYVPGIEQFSSEYRHYHIAYCELRGRKREEIEKPKEGNEPYESWIEEIKEEILAKMEEQNETVCACA